MSATDDRALAVLHALEEYGDWAPFWQIDARTVEPGHKFSGSMPLTTIRKRLRDLVAAGRVERRGTPGKYEWRATS